MLIKKIMLMSLVILVTSQTERTIYAQNHNRPSKDIVSVENRDVEAIISQILSCPAWDELEKGDVKTKDKIMKSLVLISENDRLFRNSRGSPLHLVVF